MCVVQWKMSICWRKCRYEIVLCFYQDPPGNKIAAAGQGDDHVLIVLELHEHLPSMVLTMNRHDVLARHPAISWTAVNWKHVMVIPVYMQAHCQISSDSNLDADDCCHDI